MGQNAPTPQDKNCGTVHCDRNSDAPSYKTALKLQIFPKKKSTFGGFLLKTFRKFERTGEKGLSAGNNERRLQGFGAVHKPKGKPRQMSFEMRLARGLWSFAYFSKFLAD